jgi:hypothetical protein
LLKIIQKIKNWRENNPILIRFCIINNELGDKFELGIKGEVDFDLIKESFPFNMKMVWIERFIQGKKIRS